MTLKVYIAQTPDVISEGTGIGQVVHAQWRYLRDYDIELVSDQALADVRCAHANGTKTHDLDVLHCHGLYWTGEPNSGHYNRYHHEINRAILIDAGRARFVTVPSPWVAVPFQREMRINPVVIGHGLDLAFWPQITEPSDRFYVLWNKNRAADVCDPTPAWELARAGIPVLATFAPRGQPIPPQLKLTGQLPHEEMKQLVQQASIYLATTKETFGIGTLEALACGTPVLGYAWGGTADLVQHGVSGYLVEPGNTAGLLEGVQYISEHWAELSDGARARAEAYTWDRVMEQYAALYRHVADQAASEPQGVSVVITNYNYGRYVHEAIESVLNQTVPAVEVIVVDDGSTVDPVPPSARELKPPDSTRLVFLTQDNQGVAAARNNGIAAASEPFVIFLDADDRLEPRYIQTLLPAMQQDRGLGIAYTGLSLIHGDSDELSYARAWPPAFDWELQAKGGTPPGNCIPSACMFRKAMWQRAGGYRQEYAPAEDAEFWTRGLSLGFRAEKITEEGWFHYRVHASSASRTRPWVPIDPWLPWINTKRYPIAAPSTRPPLVRSYGQPLISVSIQGEYPEETLERLTAQTIQNWEVLWEAAGLPDERYPFVRIYEEEWEDIYGLFMLVLHSPDDLPSATTLEDMLRGYIDTQDDIRSPLEHVCTGIGGDDMGCCGGKGRAVQAAVAELGALQASALEPGEPSAWPEQNTVRMEYLGDNLGPITFAPKDGRNRAYRGGRREDARYIDAHPEDVEYLEATGKWRRLQRVPPPPMVANEAAAPPAPVAPEAGRQRRSA